MKKNSIALLAFAILAACIANPAGAESYGLDEYLKKIESDNPDLILSRCNTEASEESVKMARSALLPTIAAKSDYTRNMKDIEKPTPVASLPGGGPLVYQDIDQNMDNEILLALGVQQRVFSAQAIATYRQAGTNRGIQKNIEDFTRESVLTAAKKLYAQTQLAQAVYAVRVDTEETSGEAFRNTEKKFNAGTATELDLRMAEVDWKNDMIAVAAARKNAELAMMALKTMAGIPLDAEVELTESVDWLPPIPEMPLLSDVLAGRSDYRAQKLAGDIADIACKAAYGTFLPDVSASLSYAYGGLGDKGSHTDYEYSALQATVSATLPLYTGGYRMALVKAAEIQKEQTAVKTGKLEDSIDQEIRSIRMRLEEASLRLDSARSLETASSRAYSLAETAFVNGLGTQLSVSQAHTNLSGARLNLQNAIYEYRAACYDWEFATGTRLSQSPGVE